MFLVLRDLNPEVVLAWTQVLGGERSLSIGVGDLLRSDVDAVVSPANSLGIMDGGIDRHYRNFFGVGVQTRLQRAIETHHDGELPVGAALVVPTGHGRITRMIAAPTMTRPMHIRGTDHVYLAARAALLKTRGLTPAIERLGFPGMGTGVGHMDPWDSAAQLRRAIEEFHAQG